MQNNFDFLFPITFGLIHSLELDHLVTVSTLAIDKESLKDSLKDGFYWGLGHFLILLLVATFFHLISSMLPENLFNKGEILVSMMLILLGIIRIYKSQKKNLIKHPHSHKFSLFAGLLHGFSGSGAIITIALQNFSEINTKYLFLIILSLSSLVSICFAILLIKLFANRKILQNESLKKNLILLTGIICLFYGIYILSKQLELI